jgi:tetratricopeptide (TPR) repeat protein/O-antigen ligase
VVAPLGAGSEGARVPLEKTSVVKRTQRLARLAARLAPIVLGIAFFLIPLFPAFITLTGAGVPGVSLLPTTPALALLAVACAIAACFVLLLLTTRGESGPLVLPLAMFPLAAAVAAVLGFDARAGALFIAILASGLMWHVTILRFFRAPHVAGAIYGSFLASGALAAAVAVVMVLAKMPAGVYTVGHGRAIGSFIVPGELAGYLIVYVPFAIAIATARESPRSLRALARIGVLTGSVAFVLTFSRAGWMGMAAAIAFFVFMQQGRRGARYAIAVVGIAIVALSFVFNSHHDPSENFTRISIWQSALAMIERFPLTGVGPFEFSTVFPLVRLPDAEPAAFHAHSFLLTVAAEAGLAGVAAALFGWWRFIVAFGARLRRTPGKSALPLAIAAGLVGTWVQGLIDMVSVVLFALWLPFMALALATAGPGAAPPARRARAVRPYATITRAASTLALGIAVMVCAFAQLGSDAVLARAAAPFSLAAHLPGGLGTRVYETLERIAPLPFVEAMLTEDALRRGDFAAASAHAARMPPGTLRDEDDARIALARGRHDEAIRRFLEAGDDAALQADVRQLIETGHEREAYALEDRVRQRLIASQTRPNAVADSWWRLGRLAARMHDVPEAERDYARARALAPFNTKYLIESGMLALQRRRADVARASFGRAAEIDPGSADAVAGMGLAALDAGDRPEAERLAVRALRMNARSSLALRLQRNLRR